MADELPKRSLKFRGAEAFVMLRVIQANPLRRAVLKGNLNGGIQIGFQAFDLGFFFLFSGDQHFISPEYNSDFVYHSSLAVAMIIRYILCLPVNIVLVALAYVLSPFLAAWSMKHGPVLPGHWRWFSTLNADLDGYIPQRVAGFDPAAKGFKLWWQRTRWTWRNPCNGWQSELLGVDDINSAFTVKRDLPLAFGFYLKLWLGWNPIKRGGNRYPLMFQISPKRA